MCVLMVGLSACGPELGACDENRAYRLAYDQSGNPAYEGQALIIQSCGAGGFCHSPGIELDARWGAPAGLDYDLQLASFDSNTNVDGTSRLRDMQRRVFNDRYAIWEQVSSGAMPIADSGDREVLGSAPVYARISGLRGGEHTATPIMGLDTAEGRDTLRNWLACGAPVVERTSTPTDRPDGGTPEPVGQVVSPQELVPLESNWEDIYTRLIEGRRCNSTSCHGGATAPDLRGQDEALETLMNGMGQVTTGTDNCSDEATPYIVPGNATSSLFYQKLAGHLDDDSPVCGDRMPQTGAPVSEASLMSIATWINELGGG